MMNIFLGGYFGVSWFCFPGSQFAHPCKFLIRKDDRKTNLNFTNIVSNLNLKIICLVYFQCLKKKCFALFRVEKTGDAGTPRHAMVITIAEAAARRGKGANVERREETADGAECCSLLHAE